MKKKILKKNQVVSDLKKLSFADLYAMFTLVSSLNNATFGKRIKAKELLRAKLAEIENELFDRVFGTNPFVLDKVEKDTAEIRGTDPIKVIESFKQQEGKTFV